MLLGSDTRLLSIGQVEKSMRPVTSLKVSETELQPRSEVWQSSPFFMEPLRPPSLQAKPSWKTLEAEMQHQAQHCGMA